MNWRWVFIVILLALVCPSVVIKADTLPLDLRTALSRQKLPFDSISLYVQQLGARSPLVALNPDRLRLPASTIKVLTTLAGLELLGPAYRWKTEAYALGPIRNGRLDGDMLIKGYGDPWLTSERFWRFVSQLREKGLVYIGGDLLVDNSYHDGAASGSAAFDATPQRAYNALPSATMVNFQATEIHFFPAEDGKSVRIALSPRAAQLNVVNQVQLIQGACSARRLNFAISNRNEQLILTVSGRYPKRCGASTMYRLLIPPEPLIYGVFKTYWRQLGGEFQGHFRSDRLPGSARLLHQYSSPPLAELIRGMNKYSNNVMTRQLLLTIGAERHGAPGSLVKGRQAIKEWLASRGLSAEALILDNGAGLSRTTQISARLLADVLRAGIDSLYAPEFLSSLPLAGVDGTLRSRYVGEPLAGRVRMKTGSIRGVKGLAGFVRAASGNAFVVVILHNHPQLSRASALANEGVVLNWVYAR